MSIAVVSDSTCDLPLHVIQELNITVVPLYINIGDKGYLDGVDITRKDFYTNLPEYTVHPSTGTPGRGCLQKCLQNSGRARAAQKSSPSIFLKD